MGGHSRWNILSDTKLSAVLPEVFLPAPEIVPGFLQDEVEVVFQNWNPLIWEVIKARGSIRRKYRRRYSHTAPTKPCYSSDAPNQNVPG